MKSESEGSWATVTVQVDLGRVRANVEAVARQTGVPVLAVVKADAYGLGAATVARAIADLVGGFVVFSLREAVEARLAEFRKPILCLGPPEPLPELHLEHGARPAVWRIDQASVLRAARPVLSVDTGMQRFACEAEKIEDVLKAGGCDEAFTHATRVEQARRLTGLLGGRGLRLHAAGSSLLDEPAARLDAVRPGLALYRGAVRVAARLNEARDGCGPAGYSGFEAPRHGVILAGYSHGLRSGPCMINGRRSRVIEVGMQSAYVELEPTDASGDEVVLLGDGLSEQDVADAWGTSPHEVLVRLTRLAAPTDIRR